jgi:hypothetical protein
LSGKSRAGELAFIPLDEKYEEISMRNITVLLGVWVYLVAVLILVIAAALMALAASSGVATNAKHVAILILAALESRLAS